MSPLEHRNENGEDQKVSCQEEASVAERGRKSACNLPDVFHDGCFLLEVEANAQSTVKGNEEYAYHKHPRLESGAGRQHIVQQTAEALPNEQINK
jgi:hypothetical protein